MTEIFSVAPSTINSMAIDATGKLYLSSFNNVYTSTNGGSTFSSITAAFAPDNYFYGPMMASPDGSVSFFNNGYSKIYKTTNQGSLTGMGE